MFIPYRPDINVTRKPIFTILVMVICFAVFLAQESSWDDIQQHAVNFCTDEVARDLEHPGKFFFNDPRPCSHLLLSIYSANDSKEKLKIHRDKIISNNDTYYADFLVSHYHAFAASAPSDLTNSLVYYRSSWNPLHMLSSSLSHASWDHLIGNLFFFFAFAMVVEIVVGSVLFLFVFLSMSFGIGVIDSLANIGQADIPTLGLSGVVFGMLTLALFFTPRIKIKFFYWFIILFGSVSVPLWMVSVWYVGWNIYDHVTMAGSGINYIAHLGGAAVGLMMGVSIFREKRHWAEGLLPRERPISENKPLLARINEITAIPIYLAAGFFILITAFLLIAAFVNTFSLQLLLSSPIFVMGYFLYRMKMTSKPDWSKYQAAMKLLKDNHYRMAFKKLEPLAEEGYPRAQYQMGRLYIAGKGVIKDVMQAGYWYELAAHRGNVHAQNELASLYIDGNGVNRDMDAALNWLRKAGKILPQAAMRLGYYSENHPDRNKRNLKEAVAAYGQAGQLFLKEKSPEDADSVLKTLIQLAPGHETTENLRARINEYRQEPMARR
jgi:membrane associated rhomboid family serine protease/TPR repeat protein